MRVVPFDNPRRFAERVMPFLLDREAENCQVIGRINDLLDAGPHAAGEEPPMQWSVEEGDKVVGVAMMSPPHPLVVTRATQAAVDALVEHLHRAAVALPGVVSPTPSRFADAWCALRRCGWETAKQLRRSALTGSCRPDLPTARLGWRLSKTLR